MGTQKALLTLMNLPDRFVDVIQTSDGLFLAREAGDCGFNAFLGKPAARPYTSPGPQRSWATFRQCSWAERRALVRQAQGKGINLRTFLPRR